VRHFPMGQSVGRLLITIALALILPLIAGLLLDRRLGVSPLWTAVGTCAGSVIGATVVYRRMSRVLAAYAPAACDEEHAEADQGAEAR